MKAKVSAVLCFDGKCDEAIALYEKAFGVKVEIAGRYKDTQTLNKCLRATKNTVSILCTPT